MDNSAPKKRGRPRKRRRDDDVGKLGVESKKRIIDSTPIALVGRYMLKEFDDNGFFLGKVLYYSDGLYRVNYEDGDFEDLESREIRGSLVGDGGFNRDLNGRRKKLDELVLRNSAKSKEEVNVVEPSGSTDLGGGQLTENGEVVSVSGDDSSSDSPEDSGDGNLGFVDNSPTFPPPELPPSSGTIGIPEQYVSHVLSVYGFLRSFSITLFLSPFTLDDFVGSLNCLAPNTLTDAIHVAVLRALRRHLETLSAEGLELGSRCLRCVDWSLLDTLTWPVYLVQYLTIMRHTKGSEWKGFYDEVLGKEYYSLSAGRKLIVLQVLCDDVLDSAELRAVIDQREELEVGIDYDEEVVNTSENGPRRVHPRYSKTSACKDREAIGVIGENSPNNLDVCGSSKGVKGDNNPADMDLDRNSDECRLCGMDGTLLCCDGCPSAYHTRCIGVMKLSIPEGSWYCPECTIQKIGPTVTNRTSLKGADIFGIDLYGQIFLGTCNHLLVLSASVNEESYLRYYSRKDIPKVLQVLCSFAQQHGYSYLGICQEIVKYWDIPRNILSHIETTVRDINSARLKEDANFPTQPLSPALKDNSSDAASVNESIVGIVTTSLETSIDTIQGNFPGSLINFDTAKQESPILNMKQYESNGSTGSVSQHTDAHNFTNQSLIEQLISVGLNTNSGNSNISYNGHANVTHFPETLSSQRKEANHTVDLGKGDNRSFGDCVYLGSLYKPQGYLNLYMHGDFAASAAAKLAALSSEESQPSEAHGSDSSKKVQSENFLQTKAFSFVASRFFWPTSERKLVEVPRERCGWCLSCKASVSSKRGCMLNHASLCATKGAMKILASIRPIKTGEGTLASIGAYILYIEESLCGLILGPFRNANYRKQWCKRVEEASTCSDIKSLLLELEENIRTIALSSDWVKLADDWLAEYSSMQSTTFTPGTAQKRGTGRRGKKQSSSVPEVTDDGQQEKSFVWWQGGQQSKLVFQKAILPKSMVRRAARQGGSKKIPGLSYTDGSEIPKRSKRLAWRAAVEMTKNASQLALQVRNLDLHIRWGDLVHPEQNVLDGKSADSEASVFRNARICSKNVVEDKVSYGVAFGSQKHLPSRVMKSIIETEQSEDGVVKFWFLESKVPLYLIKVFERSATQELPSSIQKPLSFPQLQNKRFKARNRDVFFYLTCKRDNLKIPTCISCKLDVLRTGSTCGMCKGYCHKECAISSTVSKNEDVEFMLTCKQCYNKKILTRNVTSNDSPTSTLRVPHYNKMITSTNPTKMMMTSTKPTKLMITSTKSSKSNHKSQETREKKKQATSEAGSVGKKIKNWGIVWKKKTNRDISTLDQSIQDSSADFKLKHVLLKGGLGYHRKAPECHICHQPYSSDHMYIHCDSCDHWYHAEALEIGESKVFDIAGFKCCKCRRIKSPACPFTPKSSVIRKIVIKPPKRENSKLDSDFGTTALHIDHRETATTSMNNTPLKQESSEVESDLGTAFISKQSEPSTPVFPIEAVAEQDSDPLLLSIMSSAQLVEPDSEMDTEWDAGKLGPQKLQVRRQVKREGDPDGFLDNTFSDFGYNNTQNLTDNSLENVAVTEWDHSIQHMEAGMFDNGDLDFENSDYDPQTLFTYSELLGVDGSPEEQYRMIASNDESNPMPSFVRCHYCLDSEQEPDLSCQNCGLGMHQRCLPQTEPSSLVGDWKCIQCREWC